MPDEPSSHRERAARTLGRIADVLGRPLDVFYREARPTGHLDDAATLVKLWLAIDDPDGRARILACARSIVAEQDSARRDRG